MCLSHHTTFVALDEFLPRNVRWWLLRRPPHHNSGRFCQVTCRYGRIDDHHAAFCGTYQGLCQAMCIDGSCIFRCVRLREMAGEAYPNIREPTSERQDHVSRSAGSPWRAQHRPSLPRPSAVVPSAMEGLTAGFGMGPGVPPPP